VFEAVETEGSKSSEDEIQAGQAEAEESDKAEPSTSSRHPLWSKTTIYMLTFYT